MAVRRIELRGLNEALATLDPAIALKASVRTINELIKQSRTATSNEIRKNYTVKAAQLKKHMKTHLMSASGKPGKLVVTGNRFALTSFAATRQVKAGVSVKIKQIGSRKTIKHTFLTTVTKGPASGTKLAFERVVRGGKRVGRLPIQHVTSLGPVAMFNQDRVDDVVQSLVDDKWDPVFRRNYAYYASR